MAFSLHNMLHLVSLLLAVLFICIASSSQTHDDVKASVFDDEICPKTRNPKYCFKVLGKRYKSLPDLARFIISLAAWDGGFTSAELDDDINFETNPLVVKKCRMCKEKYDGAVDDCNEMRRLLKSGSYKDLPSKASAIVAEAKACDEYFATPPGKPEDLNDFTEAFQNDASIVLVVSQMLAVGKN